MFSVSLNMGIKTGNWFGHHWTRTCELGSQLGSQYLQQLYATLIHNFFFFCLFAVQHRLMLRLLFIHLLPLLLLHSPRDLASWHRWRPLQRGWLWAQQWAMLLAVLSQELSVVAAAAAQSLLNQHTRSEVEQIRRIKILNVYM